MVILFARADQHVQGQQQHDPTGDIC
jgi:hypothetical protein